MHFSARLSTQPIKHNRHIFGSSVRRVPATVVSWCLAVTPGIHSPDAKPGFVEVVHHRQFFTLHLKIKIRQRTPGPTVMKQNDTSWVWDFFGPHSNRMTIGDHRLFLCVVRRQTVRRDQEADHAHSQQSFCF